MNQNPVTIPLLSHLDRTDAWGHKEGREVYAKLLKVVKEHPKSDIFRISLRGVEKTDASFPRESVAELARQFLGTKGICIVDVEDEDLLYNWDLAAEKKGIPLLVWFDDSYRLLGVPPTRGTKDVFELAVERPTITASEAASALNLQITNASTKLKQLQEKGYLLRKDELAPSGGIEYVYYRIR